MVGLFVCCCCCCCWFSIMVKFCWTGRATGPEEMAEAFEEEVAAAAEEAGTGNFDEAAAFKWASRSLLVRFRLPLGLPLFFGAPRVGSPIEMGAPVGPRGRTEEGGRIAGGGREG